MILCRQPCTPNKCRDSYYSQRLSTVFRGSTCKSDCQGLVDFPYQQGLVCRCERVFLKTSNRYAPFQDKLQVIFEFLLEGTLRCTFLLVGYQFQQQPSPLQANPACCQVCYCCEQRSRLDVHRAIWQLSFLALIVMSLVAGLLAGQLDRGSVLVCIVVSQYVSSLSLSCSQFYSTQYKAQPSLPQPWTQPLLRKKRALY